MNDLAFFCTFAATVIGGYYWGANVTRSDQQARRTALWGAWQTWTADQRAKYETSGWSRIETGESRVAVEHLRVVAPLLDRRAWEVLKAAYDAETWLGLRGVVVRDPQEGDIALGPAGLRALLREMATR